MKTFVEYVLPRGEKPLTWAQAGEKLRELAGGPEWQLGEIQAYHSVAAGGFVYSATAVLTRPRVEEPTW